MPLYKLTGRNHFVGDERIEQGTEVELTEKQYSRLSHKFMPVGGLGDGSEPEGSENAEDGAENVEDDDDVVSTGPEEEPAEDESDAPEDEPETSNEIQKVEKTEEELDELLEDTVPSIYDAIESGEYDQYLEKLEDKETLTGDNRTGVVDAIEERREEIN